MKDRKTLPFQKANGVRNYWLFFGLLLVLSIVASLAFLFLNIPVSVSSASFQPIIRRRVLALVTMLLVAVCQSMATITFQSITNNRLITPSILGFDALYALINTSLVYFFGSQALIKVDSIQGVLLSIAIMVIASLLIYGSLLSHPSMDVHFVLLIGATLGIALRSLTNFMQSLLSPSAFDILQAKLLGSVNNANEYALPLALVLTLIGMVLLMANTSSLNVLSLGRDLSRNLGLNYRRQVFFFLVIVTVLIAVSTALVGSMNFYGFLVVALTYEWVPTYDHRYLFPLGALLAYLILVSAYLIMNNIFAAQGVVTIVIEMIGGIVFLAVILRKERMA